MLIKQYNDHRYANIEWHLNFFIYKDPLKDQFTALDKSSVHTRVYTGSFIRDRHIGFKVEIV